MSNFFTKTYNAGRDLVTNPLIPLSNPLYTVGLGLLANYLPRSIGDSESDSASGGGKKGGGEGEGGAGGSLADILAQFYQANPAYASQAFNLTSQYLPQYAALNRKLTTQERGGNLADVLAMTPLLNQIQQVSEGPQSTAMRQTLMDQVSGELGMGGKLTPEQSAMTNESIRSGQNARGVLMGQGASNREAVARTLESMNLLTQRQEKAKSLLSMNKSQTPDPFATILGMPTNSLNLAAQQTGQGQLTPSFVAQNYWNQQNATTQANQYALANTLAQQKAAYLGV